MLFQAIMNLHLDFEASLLASSSNRKYNTGAGDTGQGIIYCNNEVASMVVELGHLHHKYCTNLGPLLIISY